MNKFAYNAFFRDGQLHLQAQSISRGVNHGGGGGGRDSSFPEFRVGDANVIRPPHIVTKTLFWLHDLINFSVNFSWPNIVLNHVTSSTAPAAEIGRDH